MKRRQNELDLAQWMVDQGKPVVAPSPLRARTYQFIACLSILPELPVIADALKTSIESWRTTPFAAGL